MDSGIRVVGRGEGVEIAEAWAREVRGAVLKWFARHGRDLPWRRNPTAYGVWVSEIMLQQTQVATVERYFERFLRQFPDVATLAAARESDVLKVWEGLGYYRRARSMLAAAREIMSRHDGRIPSDPKTLQTLPGIGRYTAAAIASIAWDQPAAIVEANTARLLSRLVCMTEPTASGAGQRELWRVAESLVARRGTSRLNQGLMDLGSMICLPRDPKCDICPLSAHCQARIAGRQHEIPVAEVAPSTIELRQAAAIVLRGKHVLLVQRQAGEWWTGLWDFPRYDLAAGDPRGPSAPACGLDLEWGERLMVLRHAVTRHRITVECHLARVVGGRLSSRKDRPARWYAIDGIEQVPLTSPARRIARRLQARLNGVH